ncbi:hypothetical protein LJT19_004238 [Salmonella enterica]|nr:hypothetical protein [Salmonella enterica]
MTERFLTLKAMHAGLGVLLCSFCSSVQAAPVVAKETCLVTSGSVINLNNVNITPDNTGTGSVLYSSNVKTDYTCNTFGGTTQRPALVFNLPYFKAFAKTLDDSGLGMNLTITESGNNPVEFSWDEIRKTSGNELIKNFGAQLPAGTTTARSATIKIDILYVTAFSQSSTVINIPAASNVLNIVPVSYAERPNGISLSSFNIRVLRNGLGTVDIIPPFVNLGHFYTTLEPSQSKQATFRVTARQVLGSAWGQAFTLPLAVTFGKGTLSGDTPQTLNLVNTDGNNTGQPNGLQLSIQDGTGRPITFDTEEPLGDINITAPASGSVSKTYTAVVTPKPGGTVKTGIFSAAIPVTVTYN